MTIMAAPSPSIVPLRSRENGRQTVGVTTRIASHAFRIPGLNVASLPPAIAMSHMPERTMPAAIPIAWADDEHADAMVNAGPVIPNSIDIALAPAFAIVFGIVMG